jgi:hypothetical protein
MGGNASPLIADLTLSKMEFNFLNKIHIDRHTAFFRYMDDVLAINFEIEDKLAAIYPQELEISQTNNVSTRLLDYLDLTLNMDNNHIKLHYKTDIFTFHINKSFQSSSCVHSRLLSGVIISQCIRFTRINNNFINWIESINNYVTSLLDRQHKLTGIIESILKFCSRYKVILYKYKIFNKKQHIHNIIKPILKSHT